MPSSVDFKKGIITRVITDGIMYNSTFHPNPERFYFSRFVGGPGKIASGSSIKNFLKDSITMRLYLILIMSDTHFQVSSLGAIPRIDCLVPYYRP